MHKLWLIIKREYLTRVKKKSFIIVTLLTPLGFALLMFFSGFMASGKMNSIKQVAVVDDGGILQNNPLEGSQMKFTVVNKGIDEMKSEYVNDGYDVLLHLDKIDNLNETKVNVNYYTDDKMSFFTIESLENKLSKAIKAYKLNHSTIDKEVLAGLETEVTLENGLKDGEGIGDNSSKMASGIAQALGYIMGFMMYMVIFIFGGMVMRSVMEEKINRIVEVMISSVKPFQLMLGKVIGVGLVGLTQLIIWIVLIGVAMMIIPGLMMSSMDSNTVEMAKEIQNNPETANAVSGLIVELKNQNWLLIIPVFIIYFLGGYFIYSSLFAAVGSAIGDDLGEGQQLMMPIVIPVILAIVMLSSVMTDPDGPIAVFGSMFPLFSPILMPARLPFDPPMWQVIVSILLLIGCVILFVWIAGRIYRVGNFLYGKKVSFKELTKWMFYKG